MTDAVLTAWLIFKFLLPAAFGSALAVFIDKAENTTKRKAGLFTFGAAISIFGGNGIIEHFNITGNHACGAIYFALGVWGMGIVIQIGEKIPLMIDKVADKWFSR